jgi:putative oxidoreductase
MNALGTDNASVKKNTLLLGGGYFSLAFAVFQISGIFWPPQGIKYFGGPAELSQTQPVLYALLCIVVAAIVAVFGIYALSGAGQIRRLPLFRTVITVATVIYLLRGLLLIPQVPAVVKNPNLIRFALFSAVSLCVGLIHLGGLVQLFRQVSPCKSQGLESSGDSNM